MPRRISFFALTGGLLLVTPVTLAQSTGGCYGRPESNDISFTTTVSPEHRAAGLTISGATGRDARFSIYWGDGTSTLQTTSRTPTHQYDSASWNYGVQVFATWTGGFSHDCVEGRVVFNSGCVYVVSPSSAAFSAKGGTGSFEATTHGRTCSFEAFSNASWVTVTSSGTRLVEFSVAPNTSSRSRLTTISAGGDLFTVAQEGAVCEPTFSRTSFATGNGAIGSSFTVTMPSGCGWTAVPSASWITTTSTGNGSGTVSFSLSANTAGPSRTGTINVAGKFFPITQSGSRCPITISPWSATIPPEGDTGRVFVMTPAGCSWQVRSNVTWIGVKSPGLTGPGYFDYSVTARTAGETGRRRGTVSVGDKLFAVSQLGYSASLWCSPDTTLTFSRNIRDTGLTERLGDLVYNCQRGFRELILPTTTTYDITLQLNATVTNRIITAPDETDAILVVNEPSVPGEFNPELGKNAFKGRLVGPNLLRWSRVPVGSFRTSAFKLRFLNVRVNAARLDAGASVTGSLRMNAHASTAYSHSPVTIGAVQRAISSVIQDPVLGPAVHVGTATIIAPVVVSELFPAVFQPKVDPAGNADLGRDYASEAGYIGTTFPAPVGAASSGTRIRMKLRNIPTGVNVYAAVYPDSRRVTSPLAQLVSELGKPIPGDTTVGLRAYQKLVVDSSRSAVATWEIFIADPLRIESHTFSILLEFSGRVEVPESPRDLVLVSLAPVSSARVPRSSSTIPRFEDPESPQPDLVDLRVLPGAVRFSPTRAAGLKEGGRLFAVGSNYTFTYDVYNDSSTPSTGTTVRSNAPPGFEYTGCTVSNGSPCDTSTNSNEVVANVGTVPAGGTVSVETSMRQVSDVEDGTFVDSSLGASGNEVDSDPESNSSGKGFFAETCAGPLTPGSASHGAGTGGGSFTIGGDCLYWTSISTAEWITVDSGFSGWGNGTITYSVAENPTLYDRQGSVVVGGIFFPVAQAGQCTFSASAASAAVSGETAGSGSFTITVYGQSCPWSAASNAAWLTVQAPASGVGNATIRYAFAANPATTPRTGTITVAGQTYTVTQSGKCTYSVPAGGGSLPAAGGSASFTVTVVGTGCNWVAASDAAWLTAKGNGTATGSVTYTAGGNPATTPRTANVNVGGQTFAVTQAGTCVYTLPSAGQTVAAGGGTFTFGLTASGAGCAWSALSNSAWISGVTAGGNGSATLAFTVAANAGTTQRTGTVTVGGQTYTVTQPAFPSICSFSLTPATASVGLEGGSGTFVLAVTGTGCEWTAASDQTWAQVGPPLSGTSGATIPYRVFPNFGTKVRTAVLTLGTQPFTITQAANTEAAAHRFVRMMYFGFLGRSPTADEITYHAWTPRATMAYNFFNTTEFKAGGRFVAALYVALLQRDAEYGGWQFHRLNLARTEGQQNALAQAYLSTPEFLAKFGVLSDEDFIRLVYQNFLNRAATPEEVAFQLPGVLLPNGRGALITAMLQLPEFDSTNMARLQAFLLYSSLLMRDSTLTERVGLMSGLGTANGLHNAITNFVNSAEMNLLLQ